MATQNFPAFYGFVERPDNDGQALHTTPGDKGGATVWGWTWTLWQRVAPLHGIEDISFGAFVAQTRESLEPLTRAQFWNAVQADHMPSGVDVFWTDFAFGSGGATKVLQAELGVTPDGVVGTVETLPALVATADLAGLLGRFLTARKAYYDRCGFKTQWPGLYRRADDCLALALSLIGA